MYHRGTPELSKKYPRAHYGSYGPQVIGATWLVKVPADDPRAATLKH